MSDYDTAELDKLLDDFYAETRIWPPGRDSPAAMGDPHEGGRGIACDALVSWRKQQIALAAKDAEIERLRTVNDNWHTRMSFVQHDEDAYVARIAAFERALKATQVVFQVACEFGRGCPVGPHTHEYDAALAALGDPTDD